ncbi:MAG: hypothetical protein QXU67_06625 [Candidatus Bathyarchaeia archaeon]
MKMNGRSFRLFLDDKRLIYQKMRDNFRSLVDYIEEDKTAGYLISIPSNYGYVFFWYGFLDEEALSKYYKDYVSEEKMREIDEAKEKEGEYFSISEYVRNELFVIAYDHPDVIGEGFAEVYLSIIEPDFEKLNLERTIKTLKSLIKKLERLLDFEKKYYNHEMEDIEDMEINYEVIDFANSRASEEEIEALKYKDFDDSYYPNIFRRRGWEICLRILFNGDETLKEVIEKIDKAISPLKGIVNKMRRYEPSYYPF